MQRSTVWSKPQNQQQRFGPQQRGQQQQQQPPVPYVDEDPPCIVEFDSSDDDKASDNDDNGDKRAASVGPSTAPAQAPRPAPAGQRPQPGAAAAAAAARAVHRPARPRRHGPGANPAGRSGGAAAAGTGAGAAGAATGSAQNQAALQDGIRRLQEAIMAAQQKKRQESAAAHAQRAQQRQAQASAADGAGAVRMRANSEGPPKQQPQQEPAAPAAQGAHALAAAPVAADAHVLQEVQHQLVMLKAMEELAATGAATPAGRGPDRQRPVSAPTGSPAPQPPAAAVATLPAPAAAGAAAGSAAAGATGSSSPVPKPLSAPPAHKAKPVAKRKLHARSATPDSAVTTPRAGQAPPVGTAAAGGAAAAAGGGGAAADAAAAAAAVVPAGVSPAKLHSSKPPKRASGAAAEPGSSPAALPAAGDGAGTGAAAVQAKQSPSKPVSKLVRAKPKPVFHLQQQQHSAQEQGAQAEQQQAKRQKRESAASPCKSSDRQQESQQQQQRKQPGTQEAAMEQQPAQADAGASAAAAAVTAGAGGQAGPLMLPRQTTVMGKVLYNLMGGTPAGTATAAPGAPAQPSVQDLLAAEQATRLTGQKLQQQLRQMQEQWQGLQQRLQQLAPGAVPSTVLAALEAGIAEAAAALAAAARPPGAAPPAGAHALAAGTSAAGGHGVLPASSAANGFNVASLHERMQAARASNMAALDAVIQRRTGQSRAGLQAASSGPSSKQLALPSGPQAGDAAIGKRQRPSAAAAAAAAGDGGGSKGAQDAPQQASKRQRTTSTAAAAGAGAAGDSAALRGVAKNSISDDKGRQDGSADMGHRRSAEQDRGWGGSGSRGKGRSRSRDKNRGMDRDRVGDRDWVVQQDRGRERDRDRRCSNSRDDRGRLRSGSRDRRRSGSRDRRHSSSRDRKRSRSRERRHSSSRDRGRQQDSEQERGRGRERGNDGDRSRQHGRTESIGRPDEGGHKQEQRRSSRSNSRGRRRSRSPQRGSAGRWRSSSRDRWGPKPSSRDGSTAKDTTRTAAAAAASGGAAAAGDAKGSNKRNTSPAGDRSAAAAQQEGRQQQQPQQRKRGTKSRTASPAPAAAVAAGPAAVSSGQIAGQKPRQSESDAVSMSISEDSLKATAARAATPPPVTSACTQEQQQQQQPLAEQKRQQQRQQQQQQPPAEQKGQQQQERSQPPPPPPPAPSPAQQQQQQQHVPPPPKGPSPVQQSQQQRQQQQRQQQAQLQLGGQAPPPPPQGPASAQQQQQPGVVSGAAAGKQLSRTPNHQQAPQRQAAAAATAAPAGQAAAAKQPLAAAAGSGTAQQPAAGPAAGLAGVINAAAVNKQAVSQQHSSAKSVQKQPSTAAATAGRLKGAAVAASKPKQQQQPHPSATTGTAPASAASQVAAAATQAAKDSKPGAAQPAGRQHVSQKPSQRPPKADGGPGSNASSAAAAAKGPQPPQAPAAAAPAAAAAAAPVDVAAPAAVAAGSAGKAAAPNQTQVTVGRPEIPAPAERASTSSEGQLQAAPVGDAPLPSAVAAAAAFCSLLKQSQLVAQASAVDAGSSGGSSSSWQFQPLMDGMLTSLMSAAACGRLHADSASWALTDGASGVISGRSGSSSSSAQLQAAAILSGGADTAVQRMPRGKYESSLTCFKAYRLAPQYQDVHGRDPASSTFCNSIDPDWPLCSFEVRGSHLDSKCKHQHWADATLPLTGVAAQLQQMLTAAGVPSPAVLVQNWKTSMQQAAAQKAQAQQLQLQKNAKNLLLRALVSQKVDWVRLVDKVHGVTGGVGGGQQKEGRADAATKAAAADMPAPAALVTGPVLGATSGASGSGSSAASREQQAEQQSARRAQQQQQQAQQPVLLATSGVQPYTLAHLRQLFLKLHETGVLPSSSTAATGQQWMPFGSLGQQQQLPLPWGEGPFAAYDQPPAGLDLYNMPDGKQRAAWLEELQQQRSAAAGSGGDWVAGTAQGARQQQQQQQRGDGKEWRYFNAAGWQGQDAARAGAGASAAAAAAGSVLGPRERTAAVIAQVDALFQEQQQQNEDWWLAWALTMLGVLSGPVQHLLTGTREQQQQQQQQDEQDVPLLLHDLLAAANQRLRDGLNAHKNSQKLWLLQIHLLQLRGGFDASQAAILERGENSNRGCYQIWLLSGMSRHLWQLQAITWVKGLAGMTVAAASTTPARTSEASSDLTTANTVGGSKDSSSSPPAEHLPDSTLAGCVLDLALRLIKVLCEAGAEVLLLQLLGMLLGAVKEAVAGQAPTRHSLAQWKGASKACKGLVNRTTGAAAGGAAAAVWDAALEDMLKQNLGRFAVRGLLAVLLQHPVELEVLLVSAAHAAACSDLPQAVLTRLNYPQAPVIIDAAEFGQQLVEAGGGPSSPRLQLAGQIVKAAAQLLLEGPVVQLHTVRRQQQQHQKEGVPSAGLGAARDALSCSFMALQPYWDSLGLSAAGAAADQTQSQHASGMLLGLRVLQAVPSKQSQLSRGVAGLLAAAGDVQKCASATALIVLLLLGQQDTSTTQSAVAAVAADAAAGCASEQVTMCDAALLRAQAVMQATRVLVRIAFGTGAEAAAPLFCGLWLVPEHLAQHAAPLRHPEVLAALSAAAADVDYASLAADISSRGSRVTPEQLQQQLQQHILGAAASGLLYAHTHKAGAPKQAGSAVSGLVSGSAGAGVLQQAFAQGNGPVGAVWMLLQHLQQQQRGSAADHAADAVRQSYVTLLDNLSHQRGAGSGGSVQQQQQQQQMVPQQQQQLIPQQQQQQQPSVLQQCLAKVNWAGYEASHGSWGMACQHILTAAAEAHLCMHSKQVLPLLQGCFMGIFTTATAAAAASSTAAQAAGPVELLLGMLLAALKQQQQQQGDSSPYSYGSNGSCLAALQHPVVVYEHAGVREKLSCPSLQLPHMLLGSVMDKLLQPLARKEVVKAVELLVAVAPASPALVQLLLQLLPRFPGDQPLFWHLPLLISTLCKSVPTAPVSDWVTVVQLAHRVSPASAAEVARRGAEVHPWSKQLWQLHVETQAAGAERSAATQLAGKRGLPLQTD